MINVMFMQSQSFFGADSELHAQLMRYLDREQVRIHVALTDADDPNPRMNARARFLSIPNVYIRTTDFGMSMEKTPNLLERATAMPRLIRTISALARYIRQHAIQVIHCTEKPRDAFLGVLLAKITGVRCIVHMHVSYGTWLKRSVKWALQNADAVIGVSPFTTESIIATGYPATRAFTVLNALDLASKRWEAKSDPTALRAALGIPPDAVVLGVVSRLFLYKGHKDLLQALAHVNAQMPDYRLVIVGEDDPRAHPGGGSFTAELQQLADQLGITDKLIFTGFRTDIPDLMAMFDMYTMPSWEEPFGMVYLEAMALYKPVVALRLAGPEAIIVDGETGYLTPPNAIPELGAAIAALANNPGLRQQFGQAGRKRVEKYFSSHRMCDDVLDIYQRLVH